jgi:probable addiction module antidote protein
MAKTKTSQKRAKKFSLDDMPIVKMNEEGVAYSPTEQLRDKEFIAIALLDALMDGDLPAFKEIIKAHYEALNIDATLKKARLSRRTFYDAMSDKGNPSLQTVSKIMKGIRSAA